MPDPVPYNNRARKGKGFFLTLLIISAIAIAALFFQQLKERQVRNTALMKARQKIQTMAADDKMTKQGVQSLQAPAGGGGRPDHAVVGEKTE